MLDNITGNNYSKSDIEYNDSKKAINNYIFKILNLLIFFIFIFYILTQIYAYKLTNSFQNFENKIKNIDSKLKELEEINNNIKENNNQINYLLNNYNEVGYFSGDIDNTIDTKSVTSYSKIIKEKDINYNKKIELIYFIEKNNFSFSGDICKINIKKEFFDNYASLSFTTNNSMNSFNQIIGKYLLIGFKSKKTNNLSNFINN